MYYLLARLFSCPAELIMSMQQRKKNITATLTPEKGTLISMAIILTWAVRWFSS